MSNVLIQRRMSRTGWRGFLLAVAMTALAGIGSTGTADDEAIWQAGLAKAVITPETPVWLAGYGSKRVPDEVLHEIWMKALALEDTEGNQFVLVTSDFQGVPKMMSDRVFAQVQEQFGLERRQVMFTFSHNHCGPRLGDDLIDYYPVEEEQEALVAEYTDLMVERAVAMIGEALENLAPARLQQGMGETTFAVNRRDNVEDEVPALRAAGKLKGAVDHDVPVLTVTRPDGSLAAVLFGYACHPTTMSFTKVCGDYPGYAQVELEERHPGALAMFVNTCGGDQNPLPRRQLDLCKQYGHMLATAVEEGMAGEMTEVTPGIRSAFESVDLAYVKVATREDLNEAAESNNDILSRWARRMQRKLDAGETFEPTYPYPVHACRLGNEMLIIGMGAETVVDFALRFKEEYGPSTWVMGYSDDMISYIPSRRVWDEGGYEGGARLYEYGRPAFRWAGDVEDRIAAAVERLANEVGR